MPRPPAVLPHDPDIALMLRVQRDEPGAFTDLERRFRGIILARLARWLGDRDEAEDLTQDVLLRLYRSRRSYRPTARFGTWLFHIVRNVARNAARARKRRHWVASLAEASVESRLGRVEGPDVPWGLERRELADVVRAAVADLGGRQRLALELQQFQHRSYIEVAARLHITPKAAKSLLYRARHQLRLELLKRHLP
jgi:RNA polymerase sigma-70 factor (ECF subfamily)